MATYTTNYNLYKPDASDDFGDFRSEFDDNMDIIDANLGGGGSSSLAGLSDVNLTTPTDGQVLTYDNANSEWVNANPSGGGDSVTWTQVQASGTKIAEIDINGTTQDVYAPSGGGGGGSVNYSLSEQVVGTWIDSKPVYQKTLVGMNVLSSHMVFAHGINALGVLVKSDCILRADDNSYQIPASTDQNNIEFEVTPTNIEIWINNDFLNLLGNGGYVITLQYTKTTD